MAVPQPIKKLFETDLTDFGSVDIEGKGSMREDRFGNKYQWVYNASSIDARAGGPACYDESLVAGDTFLKHVLVDTADADIKYFAGIFISAIPTLQYGWIKVRGYYADARQAVATGGSSAVGDQLIPSTLVTTTGTGAARAFAFIVGLVATATSSGSTDAHSLFYDPHVVAAEAIATGDSAATNTVPELDDVFVKGLLA